METTKMTLYELSGYVLPGFISLLAVAVFFTWLNEGKSYLPESTQVIAIVIIASYFMGHANQAIGNMFSKKCEEIILDKYSKDMMQVKKIHNIKTSVPDNIAFKTIMNIGLSKDYRTNDMDTYVEREGFYRGSAVGFGLLSLTLLGILFSTNLDYSTKEFSILLECRQKAVLCVVSGTLSGLFFWRYLRFLSYRIKSMIDAARTLKT